MCDPEGILAVRRWRSWPRRSWRSPSGCASWRRVSGVRSMTAPWFSTGRPLRWPRCASCPSQTCSISSRCLARFLRSVKISRALLTLCLHMLIVACLDLASPTRGRISAAFTCSLSADAPCLFWQEQRVPIVMTAIVCKSQAFLERRGCHWQGCFLFCLGHHGGCEGSEAPIEHGG
jgi:hypothetical protein